jgi:hypothetical protein
MGESHVERARRICMALPEAFEQEAWGEPTWRVRKRMFAMFANDHHSDGHVALWLPAPLGVQEMLVRGDARKFFVPPYVGVKGWVGVDLDAAADDGEVAELVAQAYCMVAPKKLAAQVGG